MVRNIKLVVEYEGTRYHGWQHQENAVTVQQKLEEAIFRLSGERVRTTAAGRTDAGVHARGQVVNFHLKKQLPLYKIEMGLNAHLPEDIVVKEAEDVAMDFNARFSAKQRIYHYYITTERTAIHRHFCWQVFFPFEKELLQPMAEMIIGEHDFGAFSRKEVQSDHKRCIVYESRWWKEGDFWIFRIAANRFLHGMVRTLVGTMIDVARGRFSKEEFVDIFHSRDRCQAGPAAPAKGLVLEEVKF
ncbi:MAG: tRNA pseudouridine(38-40) synthase TruA [Calditrichaeota bacterium]|nr:MAG: tRNA pseudouridine(38-40) synthase TruA [Calditrichota bacterium]